MSSNIVEIRHLLHCHPDISGNEQYAHDSIVAELHRLSPTAIYDHVGGYGVIAFWKSHSGKDETLAFRADIDALPSGHRCGHDGHTAILLRFAQIVDATFNRSHNILLIFQPEEETGKGAKKIVASGIMQKYNVKAVFGLHNLPGYKLGEVVINRHIFAAASCGVIYRLIGRATHASTPEKGLNPGCAVANIINRINDLNRNVKNYDDFCLATLICCRVGEETFGTSAGLGEVMFTLRAFTNDTMLKLMSDADAIAIDESRSWQLELEKQMREPFRATENTTALVDQIKSIFVSNNIALSERNEPFRWSEDFAEYLRIFSGVFFGIGSGESHPELHNPEYNFPDEIIEQAAHCFELVMNNIVIS